MYPSREASLCLMRREGEGGGRREGVATVRKGEGERGKEEGELPRGGRKGEEVEGSGKKERETKQWRKR
jgi:hypothetical protein